MIGRIAPMQRESCPESSSTITEGWWFGLKGVTLLLVAAIIASFPDVLSGSKTFFFRDYAIFGYPLALHHREAFWNGEIPFWNAFNNCGIPFLGQWNTLVLYPGSLIYLLLPMPWSLDVFGLVHLFVAGVGMYVLARRWTGNQFAAAVAAFAFVFNGLTLSCLKWPNNIAALSLMPLVVFAAENAIRKGGRAVIVAGVIGAVQMLAGAPEVILFTWLFVGAVAGGILVTGTVRQLSAILRFAFVIAIVGGLAAAQLIPFLELLGSSQRSTAYADSRWAMPPWGIANFIVPLFRAMPQHHGVFAQYDQYWIASYYPGVGIVALGLLAIFKAPRRRVAFLCGVLCLASWLALGNAGWLYPWLREWLPLSGIMRFPIKFAVLTAFVLPLLAAFAVSSQFRGTHRSARGGLGLIAATATLLLVIAAICWLASARPLSLLPVPAERQASIALESGLGRAVSLIVFSALLVFASRSAEPHRRMVAGLALLSVIAIDSLTHAPRLNPTVTSFVYDSDAARLKILEMSPRPGMGAGRAMISRESRTALDHRIWETAEQDVLFSRGGLFCNANLIDRIPKVDGFYSLYFREQAQIEQLVYGVASPPNGLLDFLGVTQMTAPLVSTANALDWVARPSALPLVTAGQQPRFEEAPATLEGLAANDFNPRQTVFLPIELTNTIRTTNPSPTTVKLNSAAAHRIVFQTESASETLAVIAQTYDPHWKASIDGRQAPLIRANHAFQAVEVPAGSHSVVLQYVASGFRFGLAISVATLAMAVLAWMKCRPEKRTMEGGGE